jgi:hypothetical protein
MGFRFQNKILEENTTAGPTVLAAWLGIAGVAYLAFLHGRLPQRSFLAEKWTSIHNV